MALEIRPIHLKQAHEFVTQYHRHNIPTVGGKFDCLMNGNRCVNPSADAAPVRHGRWQCHGDCGVTECSTCGWTIEEYVGDYDYCPNCGAKMDLEQFGKAELFKESKGENENERF